jgi:hypothetical protein
VHHRIRTPGLKAPVSLLHLTDVHVRGITPGLERLARALPRLQPDAVVLTGDLVARGFQPVAVHRLLASLPPAPLGRFAILGNWEHWAGVEVEPWRALLAQHGVTLLVDAWADVGPLRVGGTDDAYAGTPDWDRFLAAVPRGPHVVLTHTPDAFPRLAAGGARLVLAGHTHGGQVRLPGLGAAWTPRGTGPYVHGWYEQGGAWLHVSAGLGWSLVPVRIGVPAEVAFVHLLPG